MFGRKLLTNHRHTQLLLVADSSTGVHHLICDVSDIGGSFDLDLKTPVMKLTSARKEKNKHKRSAFMKFNNAALESVTYIGTIMGSL